MQLCCAGNYLPYSKHVWGRRVVLPRAPVSDALSEYAGIRRTRLGPVCFHGMPNQVSAVTSTNNACVIGGSGIAFLIPEKNGLLRSWQSPAPTPEVARG